MGDRATLVAVASGLAFAVVQIVAVTELFGVAAYHAGSLVALVAAVVGLRRNRPTNRRPWVLILTGLTLFLVADLYWDVLLVAGDEPEGAGLFDVLYLAAYPLITIGALQLARARGITLARDVVLDGLILAIPAGVIAWALLVEPSTGPALGTLDLVVTIAYPLLDLVCIAAICWLGFGAPTNTAQRLLLLGMLSTLLADSLYAFVLGMWDRELPLDDVAWVTGYVFLGAALLHPSMQLVGQPIDRLHRRLSRRRFILLGIATAAIPAVRTVRHWDDATELVLGTASVVIVGVVLLRLAGLLREVDAARRAEIRAERRFRAFVQEARELLVVLDRDLRIAYVSPAVTSIVGVRPEELVGDHALHLVHPDDADAVVLAIEDVVKRPGDTVRYQFRIRGAGGTWRWHDAIATNLLIDPDVEGIVIHQRDVTVQREAADALRARAQHQSAIARIGALVLDGTATEHLLDEAVSLVRRTLGTTSCALFRRADGSGSLVLEAASGPARHAVGTVTVPPGRGSQAGYTIEVGEPVVSADLTAETRFERPEPVAEAASSSASVVVGGPDGPYGVLLVHDTGGRTFGPDDVAFVQVAANALALVIQRRAIAAAIQWRALHDGLTGLPNRDSVVEHIDAALHRDDPGGVAVLFCDVDHFKLINDGLGHDAGDRLLVTVADRLRAATTAHDVVARFGGDEFVVVRDRAAGEEDALSLAADLLEAIAEPVAIGGNRVELEASIGIAYVERGATTAAAALSDADAAMYKAKSRGRGRAELFDDELRALVMHRLRTEAALRDAVAGDELRLAYQPVVELGSGRTVAVEALLRWQRPDGELLGPAAFIHIAEERGLIDELGTWTVHEACRQLARWDRQGTSVDMAVNIAPRQLLGRKLPDDIAAACDRNGIDPCRLTLELTERALLHDAAAAVEAVQALADLGVRLSIDDFGTGWSSLAYLKRLPVTELKIDRSFVAEVDAHGPDRAIVEATVRLGATLGLRTVAEGIETAEQLAVLTALGCDRGQGFLLCRPLPPDELLLDTSLVAAS